MSGPIISIRDLSKLFGALAAVDNVSLDFESGQVHAIVGPNGAGKTTLINLLSGDLLPSQGTITFKGQDITKMPPFQVSQIGIGRSYQKANVFPEFSCFQNCWLGVQSRLKTSMKFFRPASRYAELRDRAEQSLEQCGLAHRRDVPADRISHGERRQLEIGMMLATEPELLLLDEPLAGMGAEESVAVLQLLEDLSKDHTLILIEHDMDAVFAIADVLTVMVNGAVLANGTADEIRNHKEVQEAYLGVTEVGE